MVELADTLDLRPGAAMHGGSTPSRGTTLIQCHDLVGYLKLGCCTSCHEDVWQGFELLEIELGEDIYFSVCCDVYRELESNLGIWRY